MRQDWFLGHVFFNKCKYVGKNKKLRAYKGLSFLSVKNFAFEPEFLEIEIKR